MLWVKSLKIHAIFAESDRIQYRIKQAYPGDTDFVGRCSKKEETERQCCISWRRNHHQPRCGQTEQCFTSISEGGGERLGAVMWLPPSSFSSLIFKYSQPLGPALPANNFVWGGNALPSLKAFIGSYLSTGEESLVCVSVSLILISWLWYTFKKSLAVVIFGFYLKRAMLRSFLFPVKWCHYLFDLMTLCIHRCCYEK